MRLFFLCMLFALSGFAFSSEIVSTRFEDSVGSNGSGTIDLLRSSTGDKIITSQELEQFRVDNGGLIVLAADINEAANGTEKSESQGVAIKTLSLDITIASDVYSYSVFTTQTQSSLAEKGSTNRRAYYTLIGETGSSRITSSQEGDIHNSSFDSTISIPVDIDISSASEVMLRVELLDTNSQLGDPEAFYDYSGGFEDLAIVTYEDATYLDNLAAGRDLAPLVVLTEDQSELSSFVYYPSSDAYYVVGYEDNYPDKGDYDFNDLVVGYQVRFGLDLNGRVKSISGEGYLVARGGAYNHDWLLHIDLPEGVNVRGEMSVFSANSTSPMDGFPRGIESTGQIIIDAFSDTQYLYTDPSEVYVNTLWYQEHIAGPKFSFDVTFDNGVPVHKLPQAPFDPILFVRNTDYELHLKGKEPVLPHSSNSQDGLDSFVDENGYPFAMVFPENWLFPNEYVDLGAAYPEFIEYIESNKSTHQNWFENGVARGITKHDQRVWRW